MGAFVDHYRVLGLPSGEEGAKLTEKEITKAYKSKALKLHPDKRRYDQNAASNFQQLQTSYDLLRDDKREKERQSQRDGKRRKMVSDLERREGEAVAAAREREREDRVSRKLEEEISQVAAIREGVIRLANSLLVLPLLPAMRADPLSAPKSAEPDKMSNLDQVCFPAYDNSVLEKHRKVAFGIISLSVEGLILYLDVHGFQLPVFGCSKAKDDARRS